MIEGRSHGLGFLPRLAPHVDAMAADQDRTGLWVFLHGPSHPVLQVPLLRRVFNDGHNQRLVISESKLRGRGETEWH